MWLQIGYSNAVVKKIHDWNAMSPVAAKLTYTLRQNQVFKRTTKVATFLSIHVIRLQITGKDEI